MSTPFEPNFLKKIQAYQKFNLYKRKNKPIWRAMEIALKWADGPSHNHIASWVHSRSISDEIVRVMQSTSDIEYRDSLGEFAGNTPLVLQALVQHDYAEQDPGSENQIKFTKEGFVTGRVLIEAENPVKRTIYGISSQAWWIIFVASVVGNALTLYFRFNGS